MNTMNPDEATPTVADEASAVVSDEQVIEKTLPPPTARAPIKAQVDRALCATRDYVVEQPMQSVLIAAAAGAALSALVTICLRDDRGGIRY